MIAIRSLFQPEGLPDHVGKNLRPMIANRSVLEPPGLSNNPDKSTSVSLYDHLPIDQLNHTKSSLNIRNNSLRGLSADSIYMNISSSSDGL